MFNKTYFLMKKNVAIVMGGYSSEHDISVKSGNTVFDNINCKLFNPYKVIISNESWDLVDSNNIKYPIAKDKFNTKIDGLEINFDIAFIMIHGTPGEDGIIQKYFEKLKIPYTGPSSDVASLTFNKKNCIEFANKNNIKTAKSKLIKSNSDSTINEILKILNFPLFVKANGSGSSYGISKVFNKKELKDAIKNSLEFDKEVLVEEFLNGKEVSVGVMNFKDEIKVFGISEIITSNDFFDYEAKYEGKSKDITPANLTDNQISNVKKAAINLYKKLNMSGFSRSDFIFIEDDPFLLEINSIPGMTEYSIFPKQVKMNGISLKELFTFMIENSL